MKKIVLLSLAVVALATPAFAADSNTATSTTATTATETTGTMTVTDSKGAKVELKDEKGAYMISMDGGKKWKKAPAGTYKKADGSDVVVK